MSLMFGFSNIKAITDLLFVRLATDKDIKTATKDIFQRLYSWELLAVCGKNRREVDSQRRARVRCVSLA